MKRLFSLAALAGLAALASTAVEAQYYPYPQPGYGGPPPGYYDGQPRYRRPPPPGYGYGYRPPVQYGQVCLTSRGSCYTGRPLQFGTGCGCSVPVFGYKRGAIGG